MGLGFLFISKYKNSDFKKLVSLFIEETKGELSSQKDLQKVISKKENILKFIKVNLGIT